jgi:4-amino-4-deoxy-L-arabinose transferase-like glycosyltransferase
MVSAWRGALVRSGLVYVFSRLCVALGAAIVAAELRADLNKVTADFPNAPFADPNYFDKAIPKNAVRPMLDVLNSWDGQWYLRIVTMGYPRHVQPHVTFDVLDARAAFFPLYPMVVRAADRILPGHETIAAFIVNFVLGAVAVFLVGLLARQLFDVKVGERAMVLMAVFPGAFVLSFTYSEALLLTVAAGCLWCLLNRYWLAAGILAALGTATRPNGLALCLACLVAAVIAIYRRRDWWALLAPALSPIGLGLFMLLLDRHAHETGIWFRVQREAWKEGTSFGFTALRRTFAAFAHPLTSPTDLVTAVSVLAMLVLLYLLWRRRLPWPIVGYIAGVLLLMLIPSTVTARPRFLYTAFPLLISAAAWFEYEDHRGWWPYAVGACCAGLTGLTALYGVLGAIP